MRENRTQNKNNNNKQTKNKTKTTTNKQNKRGKKYIIAKIYYLLQIRFYVGFCYFIELLGIPKNARGIKSGSLSIFPFAFSQKTWPRSGESNLGYLCEHRWDVDLTSSLKTSERKSGKKRKEKKRNMYSARWNRFARAKNISYVNKSIAALIIVDDTDHLRTDMDMFTKTNELFYQNKWLNYIYCFTRNSSVWVVWFCFRREGWEFG